MSERIIKRLQDIKQNVDLVRKLLETKTLADLRQDRMLSAAFERFLEIISEASRHVPEALRQEHAPQIAWRRVADLGNALRHAYRKVEPEMLWNIYENDLDALELAVVRMLHALQHPGTAWPGAQ